MRLLLVEDDRNLSEFVQEGLAREGFSVDLAQDGNAAMDCAGDTTYDVILLDVMMPGLDGLGVMKVLTHMAPGLPVVLSTGAGDDPAQTEKVTALGQLGVGIMLTKPYTAEDLLQALRAVLPAR